MRITDRSAVLRTGSIVERGQAALGWHPWVWAHGARLCYRDRGGHDPEVPPFHDCGMHYVDVARWLRASACGATDPGWVQVHGTFANGVVFDITQGFIYGHLSKEQPHNCYLGAIGTKGCSAYRHDFSGATVERYSVHQTWQKTAPFKDKKLDLMVDVFARLILAGKNLGFQQARDSGVASEVSWTVLNDAIANVPPVRGTHEEMQQMLQHRRKMVKGFGLPVKNFRLVDTPRFQSNYRSVPVRALTIPPRTRPTGTQCHFRPNPVPACRHGNCPAQEYPTAA